MRACLCVHVCMCACMHVCVRVHMSAGVLQPETSDPSGAGVTCNWGSPGVGAGSFFWVLCIFLATLIHPSSSQTSFLKGWIMTHWMGAHCISFVHTSPALGYLGWLFWPRVLRMQVLTPNFLPSVLSLHAELGLLSHMSILFLSVWDTSLLVFHSGPALDILTSLAAMHKDSPLPSHPRQHWKYSFCCIFTAAQWL